MDETRHAFPFHRALICAVRPQSFLYGHWRHVAGGLLVDAPWKRTAPHENQRTPLFVSVPSADKSRVDFRRGYQAPGLHTTEDFVTAGRTKSCKRLTHRFIWTYVAPHQPLAVDCPVLLARHAAGGGLLDAGTLVPITF